LLLNSCISYPTNQFLFNKIVFTFAINEKEFALSFTALIQKVPEGYIGFIEELPGANSQAETLEELRENLKEAIQLVLEANKLFVNELLTDSTVIRESINLSAL
jgi:predicted RNase H-like HicB family nuclease